LNNIVTVGWKPHIFYRTILFFIHYCYWSDCTFICGGLTQIFKWGKVL